MFTLESWCLFFGIIYFATPLFDRLFGGGPPQPATSRWNAATIALVVLAVVVLLLLVFGPPTSWRAR